jgi:hypothetical protein
MVDYGFDLWHLGVVEWIPAYDGQTPEGGCEKDWSVPIASAIAELEFIELGEELQPVVARDNDGGLRGVASDEMSVGRSHAEGFQGGGIFRAGPALGQPKVHIDEVPRSVEIYVDEATLDLETLKHFTGRFGSLVIQVLRDIGKEAEMERGPFRAVEEGRPTFGLAVPVAPQVLGIDGDLVPVAAYKQKSERSGFCCTTRAGGPHNLQKPKEDGFEHFWGDLEYREVRVVGGFLDYVPQIPFNGDLPANKAPIRLLALVRRIKQKHTAMEWQSH